MNNLIFKYFIIFIFCILGQIFISEYLNIWHLLYITFFTPFIISIPITINKSLYIIIAFIIGFLVDIFADGLLGLNAAALVAMTYSRGFILRLPLFRLNLDNIENSPILPRNLGIVNYIILNTFLYIVFFFFYIILDYSYSFPIGYLLLKLTICVIINTLISVLINSTLLPKIIK